MILARMICVSEDDLICDLAETYGILNYKQMIESSPSLVATLSVGLSMDSRIKRKMIGCELTLDQMLASLILDGINTLVWFGTKDGAKGRNRPKSIYRALMGLDKKPKDELMTFDSPEAYEEWMMSKRKEWNNG